ncbi:MAG: hypothetical protein QME27_00285, partial [Syntrophaceae bacterium]|nr:hypothetical protein [Syntrophaceae bacterium]
QDWLGAMPECGECVRTFDAIGDTLRAQANRLYANFLWLVELRQRLMAGSTEKNEPSDIPGTL